LKQHPNTTQLCSVKGIIIAFLLVFTLIPALQAQKINPSVGYASYYHDKFVGRKTASGQLYKHEKMTCAHRTLPFGTTLKVTNLSNNKSVIVTVNDRGPFVSGRIIDLSKSAAVKLDFIKAGQTKVKITFANGDELEPEIDSVVVMVDTTSTLTALSDFYVIHPIDTFEGSFTIQLGAYKSEKEIFNNIDRINQELNRQVIVEKVTTPDGMLYRLFVGVFANRLNADEYLLQIRTFYPGSFVVALKRK
jgi:rare lipoprotein A